MVGRTISHYKILEKIGEGGMGVVYKAEDTKLYRTVALKFLRPDAVESRELKARFLNEAEAAAALDHPNICTVHEIDEVDGQMFIAMACVEGESLAKRIRKRPLPIKEALDIAIQVAEGLHAVHKKGVIHRDIKPANLMIDPDGRVKVTDFGLAHLEQATKITKTGTVLGTPAYMSPEQVRGETSDHRTDIWSLGVVLYETVTGQLPFKGEVQEAVAHSVVYEEPELPTALRSGVPIELDRIIGKALTKSPQERYQHVDEILVDLRRCRSLGRSGESGAKPPPTLSLTERRWPYALIGVIVALSIAAAIWHFVPTGSVSSPGQVSIAVLPLRLLSAETPRQEFLSSGLTEQLITHLAQISSLNVIAHTSVLRFKDTEQAIPEIGRMLNVDHVVEGSVVRVGNQLRITAQLIEAATDHHVWAGTYQREFQDVLSLQDEVAQAIAQEVNASLTPEESQRFQRSRQVNPEAYEAYLQGKFFQQELSAEGLSSAIEQFKLAIREDPSYAPTYAALADAYIWAGFFGFESGKKLYPIALATAIKAVELDGSLAEAHAALAASQAVSWNWPQAKRSFDRAFELNSGIANIHFAYAMYWLSPQRRTDEALSEQERAVQLDPLSAFQRIGLANITGGTGDLVQSIEMLEALTEQNPSPMAFLSLAPKYARVGRCEDAITAMEKAKAFGLLCIPCRAVDLAQCGRGTEAREELVKMEQTRDVTSSATSEGEEWPAISFAAPHGSPAIVARTYAILGETDKAFEWLERAYEERDIYLLWVNVIWAYDPLRSDPRYADLLRRMNLEP